MLATLGKNLAALQDRRQADLRAVDAQLVPASRDTSQQAQYQDGKYPAMRYARTPEPEDDRVVSALEQMGARIIGTVPTGFPDDPRSG